MAARRPPPTAAGPALPCPGHSPGPDSALPAPALPGSRGTTGERPRAVGAAPALGVCQRGLAPLPLRPRWLRGCSAVFTVFRLNLERDLPPAEWSRGETRRQTDRQMVVVVVVVDVRCSSMFRTTRVHVPSVSLMAAVLWHDLPKKNPHLQRNPYRRVRHKKSVVLIM